MFERFFYWILAMIVSYMIIRYRYKINDMTWDMEFCNKWLWSTKNWIVFFWIFIFFIALLYMTDNLSVLFPSWAMKFF